MAISTTQKSAIERVIDTLVNLTSSRGKRQLSEMFMELPDKEAWPEYYEVRFDFSINYMMYTHWVL